MNEIKLQANCAIENFKVKLLFNLPTETQFRLTQILCLRFHQSKF
jgi:hypothetical protein